MSSPLYVSRYYCSVTFLLIVHTHCLFLFYPSFMALIIEKRGRTSLKENCLQLTAESECSPRRPGKADMFTEQVICFHLNTTLLTSVLFYASFLSSLTFHLQMRNSLLMLGENIGSSIFQPHSLISNLSEFRWFIISMIARSVMKRTCTAVWNPHLAWNALQASDIARLK
jgi:hypothetical protein